MTFLILLKKSYTNFLKQLPSDLEYKKSQLITK